MKRLTKFMVIGVLVISFLPLFPQKITSTGIRLYCVFTFEMENKDRYIYEKPYLYDECPGSGHTAPWCNWGVVSNVGDKEDDYQFMGWKWVEGWYQWNTCTAPNKGYEAPTPCSGVDSYYNAKQTSEGCWEQKTLSGININKYGMGSRWIEIPRFAWDDG
ncbi:MAG: hypothetical protein OEZ30_08925 [Candidatus Aminicenantes bacterium]|nr:hypothetical protein [Candidatus Aminicenantes bacterium]MDH5715672.1 hypothetical protein [Candidatus Aminicenantes bacterium]